MDKILKIYKSGKTEWLFKAICSDCGCDRGYVKKRCMIKTCRTCSGKTVGSSNTGKPGPNLNKSFSSETKTKMSQAKIGKVPWNKGLIGVSEETRQKMSIKGKERKANNIGQSMTYGQKIKLSCINQGIDLQEFSGFVTPINRVERASFYELNLHTKCFEQYNFTCDKCQVRGTSLNAHHMNSWAFFKEDRFDLSNLVCLCDACHREFHSTYGNGKASPNTKEQYLAFKYPVKKELPTVTEAPASVKSLCHFK